MRRLSSIRPAVAAVLLWLVLPAGGPAIHAQAPARDYGAAAPAAEPAGESATVVFLNRSIVVLRARVLGRSPDERADSAHRAFDALVDQGITGPVDVRPSAVGAIVTVASRGVLAITPDDIDAVAGEQVDSVAATAADRIRLALQEGAESRTPRALLRAALMAVLLIAIAAVLLWSVAKAQRFIANRFAAMAEETAVRTGLADVAAVRASRVFDIRRLAAAIAVILDLVILYTVAGLVLREFPYTRPWGESMRGSLIAAVERAGVSIAGAVPGLLAVLVILLIARFVVRLMRLWFNAVEQGRLRPRWIYPETAQPTRRILTGMLWVFAVVIAYPYMPGSQTDAFKGVSVFFGLMLTFGSSGLVNQIMSGFMITYSRALRVGDFVRIGDVEGTVTHLGVLSTKLLTPWREEITIPNTVVVSQTTTDYSRNADTDGVFTPASVTIGYDAPWRQVHALLLLAAERTPGLRRDRKPLVVQASLEDFYVKYTLLVCLEQQFSKPFTLDRLHANIQDLFNEYGVQIMSPNYMLDPAQRKIVEKKDWFAAPASPEQNAELRT